MSLIPPTWTPDRIEELKRLFEAGHTCSQIAREIGVTRNAVIGKISRLGLTRPRGDNGIRRQPRLADGTLQRQRADPPGAPRSGGGCGPGRRPISDQHRSSLFDLSPQKCRWPIGRPGADGFGFCGNGLSKAFLTVRAIAAWPTGRSHVDAAQSCGRRQGRCRTRAN